MAHRWNTEIAPAYAVYVDRYMYAGAGRHVTLLTPIYDHTTQHCLQYRRHQRSRTAGRFVLFYQRTDLKDVSPARVTLTDPIQLHSESVNQQDVWLVVKCDTGMN